MPSPEKFKESLVKFNVSEDVISKINSGYEDIVSKTPKKTKAAYFKRAVDIMNEQVDSQKLQDIFEWNACCKGGAREKASKAGADIEFEQGDSLAMRFEDDSFDAITVAYGVRNFEHLEQGYREMHRVLRPGGVLVVIELATPVNPIVRPLYNLYTRRIIPWAGRSISKDRRAYSYLPESIAAVPQRDNMLQLMRNAGFGECSYKAMTFGTCIIYMASK